MLLEAATVATEAGDIVRVGTRRAGTEPDAEALLRETQAAGLGDGGEAVQIGRRGRSCLPGANFLNGLNVLHRGTLLSTRAGATTRGPLIRRGVFINPL